MTQGQKRPGPKDFKSNLLAANQEIVRLKTVHQKLREQYQELISLFSAVLMEKHSGKVHIPISSAIKWQHHGIGRDISRELGLLTITVEKPGATLEKPQLVTLPAEPEPDTATVCENDWHADANALGFRCPVCGGKGKLVA